MTINPGKRCGTVTIPVSKSHEHRLLIADFLAGDLSRLMPRSDDSEDIVATKRCLKELATEAACPILDCGESGSTRRFLAPIAAALGKRPIYRTAGRLASRPMVEYPTLEAGVHELAGNVSSQFVTGLLFALPLVKGDSEIRFTTPLESAGYVELTLKTLSSAGIKIGRTPSGFAIPGDQRYHSQRDILPEGDWSAAAFWVVANALGNQVEIRGTDGTSVQPDRAVVQLSDKLLAQKDGVCGIDVSQCPDIFPILAVQAAARAGTTCFTGTRRLRLKESDRTVATATVLAGFGVSVDNHEDSFIIHGIDRPFSGGDFASFGDHRIAMSIAIGATNAAQSVTLDDAGCVRKSYPRFFDDFIALAMI